MLPTIELDDQTVVNADKIGDERAERNLATEFQTEQTAIAQPRPQSLLDIGLICAETPRRYAHHA